MSVLPIRMRKKKSLKASLSLEAALVLPLFLCLLIFYLGLLYLYTVEIELRWALDQCARECAALIPIAEKAGEALGEQGEKLIASLLDAGEREWLDSLKRDFAASLVLGPFIEERLNRQLAAKRAGGGLPLPPHKRRIFCRFDPEARALILELEVELPLYPGRTKREISSLVPLWSERMPKRGEEKKEQSREEDSRIWEADNFSRGRYFRKREGGTLPDSYPVIADFREGRARAIKSVDLTAPSYASPEAGLLHIQGMLAKLAAFQGHTPKSGKFPTVAAGDIRNREFVLVIPENSPPGYDAAFWERVRASAAAMGIELRISRRGESRRYGQE